MLFRNSLRCCRNSILTIGSYSNKFCASQNRKGEQERSDIKKMNSLYVPNRNQEKIVIKSQYKRASQIVDSGKQCKKDPQIVDSGKDCNKDPIKLVNSFEYLNGVLNAQHRSLEELFNIFYDNRDQIIASNIYMVYKNLNSTLRNKKYDSIYLLNFVNTNQQFALLVNKTISNMDDLTISNLNIILQSILFFFRQNDLNRYNSLEKLTQPIKDRLNHLIDQQMTEYNLLCQKNSEFMKLQFGNPTEIDNQQIPYSQSSYASPIQTAEILYLFTSLGWLNQSLVNLVLLQITNLSNYQKESDAYSVYALRMIIKSCYWAQSKGLKSRDFYPLAYRTQIALNKSNLNQVSYEHRVNLFIELAALKLSERSGFHEYPVLLTTLREDAKRALKEKPVWLSQKHIQLLSRCFEETLVNINEN